LPNDGVAAIAEQLLPSWPQGQADQDQLAQLAAAALRAPAALITVLDGTEQRLVGAFGPQALLGDRSDSPPGPWCHRVLSENRPVFVEDGGPADALAACRFSVRATAGYPLCDEQGNSVGSLCILDDEPRAWPEADRQLLALLAGAVERAVLARRRARDTRAEMTERARRIGRLAGALAAARRVEDVAAALAEQVPPAVGCQTFSLRQVSPEEAAARPHTPVFLETRALLPLLVEDELVGILAAGYATPQEFSTEEQLFLTTIADLAAQAIGRARSTEKLHRESRRHRLLSAAQAAINRRLDPASELQALARAVVPELADVATVHVLEHPVPPGRAPSAPIRTHRVASETIDGIELPPTFTELAWFADEPIPEAIKRGELFEWHMDGTAVPRWALRTGTAATFRGGLNRLVLAPVLVDDRVAAVATFGLCNDRPPWGAEDLAIIREITQHAANALEHGLTYEQSRRTALVLQRSLLSEPPQVDGLQVCVRYEPAGRDEVGGDWYDAFELEPGRLVLAVGDVVGHDITAAAAMGQLRAVLRSLAMEQDLAPGAVLDRLAEANRCLRITPFATAVFARLARGEFGDWELSWASAGHLPPVLMEPGRPARLLEQHGGLALAPTVNAPRASQTLRLERPGSTVLFFTDGLVERRGVDIDVGMSELCRRAHALGDLPMAVLCDHLVREAPHRDDVALLGIRID
jgi:GAF domain-containing protein